MSKARLVITAIEIEGRTVADVVSSYSVSRSWVYELLTFSNGRAVGIVGIPSADLGSTRSIFNPATDRVT